VKIRILGTGGATPSLRRLSSSCLVSTSEGNILIDVGPSVVRRLLEFGCDLDDVDIIVLTHFHPDHSVDLATLLFAYSYGEWKREKDLLLIGGRGIGPFFRRLSRLYPWVAPVGYRLDIKALTQGAATAWGQTSLSTAHMLHREESIGVRIEERGKSFVFSGDAGYSPALVALADAADLLIAECTFPEEKAPGHLNLAALLKIVEEAKPRRVIMSHLSPQWEEFHGTLPAPLLLGEDCLSIDL
jgi:ribonuclease BN (tRNA processing enzyme)